ncbi:MAG TPA: hypothetical protein PKD27_11110 [Tepidiformaceae bacterium]|nr:hypothetical protein [Tepidiformaceae bacterium]
MTTKQAIIEIVEGLSEERAQEVLAFLLDERDDYSEEFLARVKQGEEEIARGEFVTLEELKAEYGI